MGGAGCEALARPEAGGRRRRGEPGAHTRDYSGFSLENKTHAHPGGKASPAAPASQRRGTLPCPGTAPRGRALRERERELGGGVRRGGLNPPRPRRERSAAARGGGGEDDFMPPERREFRSSCRRHRRHRDVGVKRQREPREGQRGPPRSAAAATTSSSGRRGGGEDALSRSLQR